MKSPGHDEGPPFDEVFSNPITNERWTVHGGTRIKKSKGLSYHELELLNSKNIKDK